MNQRFVNIGAAAIVATAVSLFVTSSVTSCSALGWSQGAGTVAATAPAAGAATSGPAGAAVGGLVGAVAQGQAARAQETAQAQQALHDQAVANGTVSSSTPDPSQPMPWADVLYVLLGIVGTGSAVYKFRTQGAAIGDAAQQVATIQQQNTEQAAAIMASVIQAISLYKAGTPIDQIAKKLEDQGAPIDLTHPVVVATTVPPAPAK